EGEVAQRDDDAAYEHALVLAQPSVGDDPAHNGRRPHARRVRPVQRTGPLIGEAEHVHHVQDEKRAHPVVAEPLPHLGEEERGQTARMPEERAGLARRQFSGHAASPADSATICTRCTSVSVAFSNPRRELNSSLLWNSWPPVKMLGQGSPRNVSFEPSVPPRMGFVNGSSPARRTASSAYCVISGCSLSTSFMLR